MEQKSLKPMERKNALQAAFSGGYQLNLSDFALFMSVMRVKDAYENVLSIILDESDLRLKEVKAEQVVLNKSGKRAIRLDAWALDEGGRQFDMEMQNDASGDDIRKRSRFYQGLLDTPVLKSGKETRYKHLPSTVIVFITQEDVFGKDVAMYTFSEWCEEIPDLPLGDGTRKIFLNMSSFNGRKELVSLLQYMKYTDLENPDIIVKDERIEELDRVVREVKQSEEWEAVKMNILEIGLRQGIEQGIEQGMAENLIKNVEAIKKNFDIDLLEACEGLGITVKEYEDAREKAASRKGKNSLTNENSLYYNESVSGELE